MRRAGTPIARASAVCDSSIGTGTPPGGFRPGDGLGSIWWPSRRFRPGMHVRLAKRIAGRPGRLMLLPRPTSKISLAFGGGHFGCGDDHVAQVVTAGMRTELFRDRSRGRAGHAAVAAPSGSGRSGSTRASATAASWSAAIRAAPCCGSASISRAATATSWSATRPGARCRSATRTTRLALRQRLRRGADARPHGGSAPATWCSSISSFDRARFLVELARRLNMTIYYQGEFVTALPLHGTSAAVQEMINCQRAADIARKSGRPQGDPFAGSPQGPASGPSGPSSAPGGPTSTPRGPSSGPGGPSGAPRPVVRTWRSVGRTRRPVIRARRSLGRTGGGPVFRPN